MNDNSKIFIPLTLDNSTKSRFSGKQIIGFVIAVLVFILLQVLAVRVNDILTTRTSLHLLIAVLADIALTYFLIFLIRKIVLKEDELMRNYAYSLDLQQTDIGFCWDIFAIKEDRIFYVNGVQAKIVCLSHGYLLDRPENQETLHRDSIKNALSVLTRQGYKFLYYNREVKDSNLGSLNATERRLHKYRDYPVYQPAYDIIKHTYKACSTIATVEHEYYVILADTMETIRKLDFVTEEFLHNLHGGIYVKREVLDNAGVWDFITQLYGISYIDTSSLLSKKFEDADLHLVDIVSIDRNEVPIAEEPQAQITPEAQSVTSVETDPFLAALLQDAAPIQYQPQIDQENSNIGDDILL